jgi:hypothetical protein
MIRENFIEKNDVVAISGWRRYEDFETFMNLMNFLQLKEKNVTLNLGCAKGVDFYAKCYAIRHNIKHTIHYADWEFYGKFAGPKRNSQMIEKADKAIAFLHYESTGTLDFIQQCKEKDIPLCIVKI